MPIDWSDSPPERSTLPHIELVTLKASAKVSGIITADKMTGTYTHFMSGRTLPCSKEDCPGCNVEKPRRWEGYMSLWTRSPNQHIILRLTADGARQICDQVPDKTAMRGVYLTIKRKGIKSNGSLIVEIHEGDTSIVKLPARPNLREHLWKIWGLDNSQIAQEFPLYYNRVRAEIFTENRNGSHTKPA